MTAPMSNARQHVMDTRRWSHKRMTLETVGVGHAKDASLLIWHECQVCLHRQ